MIPIPQQILSDNILIEKITKYEDDLEESFNIESDEFKVKGSSIGKVLSLGADCKYTIHVNEEVVFQPFDCVDIGNGNYLIRESKILAIL